MSERTPLTMDDVLARALATYDRACEDANRKLVTDLLMAGHDDEEISDLLAIALEEQAAARPAYRLQVQAQAEEAARWFRGES